MKDIYLLALLSTILFFNSCGGGEDTKKKNNKFSFFSICKIIRARIPQRKPHASTLLQPKALVSFCLIAKALFALIPN
jgi:hypothetical protein